MLVNKLQNHFDIVIIGGGIIGGLTALSLCNHGLKVALLDKNSKLSNEASRAGGGIISPLHPWRYSQGMLNLASWSHEYFPKLVKQLASLSGVDIPLVQTGMLVPNLDEADAALKCTFLKSKVLTKDDVYALEPGLAYSQDSVFVEGVRNIRNPALCKALPFALHRKGVELKTNYSVQTLKKQNNHFVISSDNNKITANKVVVAAGAWSSDLLTMCVPELKSAVPEIFPIKGQMLAIKASLGVLRTVILEQNRYLIPRHDGIVIVGSTIEDQGFDKITTRNARQELLEFAYTMLPALKNYPVVSHWAGLRPGSHRDKPYICAMKQLEGLYLNMGHFRNGLLSAPASAQVLTDIILNQDSEFELDSYAI